MIPFSASYNGYKLDISSFSLIVDRLWLHTVIQTDDLPVTCCHFLKTHRNRCHIVLSSSKDSGKSVACAIFFSIAIPKSFALLRCSLGRQVFVPCRQLKFSRTLVLIQSFNRQAGGKLLPIHCAGLFTDHAHYVINQTSTVLRRKKIMAVEDGIVSPYYILVIYVAFQT